MPSLTSILWISHCLAATYAYELAHLVSQERSTYEGGWALGLPGPTCPSDAPVACGTNDDTVNPACCPSGQTCFGLTNPYCCPTSADCQSAVENLPVCANSTWNMYKLNLAEQTFFCCEPGQFGLLPLSGYAGLCEPNGQTVASSLIATSATQADAAVVTASNTGGAAASTSTKTSTLNDGSITTITTAVGGAATGSSTSTGTSGSEGSASTGSSATTAMSKIKLSSGAIAGVAIAGLAIISATIVAYWSCRRKMMNNNTSKYPLNQPPPPMTGAPLYSAVPPLQTPASGYKSPTMGVQGGYSGTPPPQSAYSVSPSPQGYGPTQPPQGYNGQPAVEVPQKWEGRVELGPGR